MAFDYAVDDLEFEFVNPPTSGDIAIISGSPSTINKADGKGVYKADMVIEITDYEDSSISSGTGFGPFVPVPPTNKGKEQGVFILRKNDITVITVAGTNKSPPPPLKAVPVSIRIKEVGQDIVKGN